MSRWFRHYNAASFDPKFRGIARKAGAPIGNTVFTWWALCEYASEHEGEIKGFDPDVVAAHLDCEPAEIKAVFAAMKGRVHDGKKLTAWDRRQFIGSTSTERMRRHRAKQSVTVTPGPVTVTPGDVTCDAVTPPDSDSDSEQKDSHGAAHHGRLPASTDDLDTLLFRRGKALLGPKAGGQIAKLRDAMGSVGAALQVIDDAARKESPAEYVAGAIRKNRNGHARHRADRGSLVETYRELREDEQCDPPSAVDPQSPGPPEGYGW